MKDEEPYLTVSVFEQRAGEFFWVISNAQQDASLDVQEEVTASSASYLTHAAAMSAGVKALAAYGESSGTRTSKGKEGD